MTTPTYYKALNWAFLLLKGKKLDDYGAEYVLLERQDWRKTDLSFHEREPMPPAVWQRFQQDVQALLTGEPAQYLLGHAWFAGLKLQVTPATLIPRQETEELVAWAGDFAERFQQPRILDLGTGSGAIALALQQRFPQAEIWASDLSTEALRVAQANGQRWQLPVNFVQGDLFAAVAQQPAFDVIISNPPYISHHEENVMDYSVKHFEPALALYAENDGLALYQRIAADVSAHLTAPGALFLEFGYQQAPAIQQLFEAIQPARPVVIRRDLAGWPRMAQIGPQASMSPRLK
ncbi:peptide chain release factor N(5)-glutamine methyltransferase [Lapidilactobacillus luobeiensis]|uniref:peptide chain release factor N(5)-glutamine methyltransferase n=1 Tax=Lapidilactobacillus luobeiensis TaxID=2950371 RepID=UPI0021C37F0E|nr:peptide chain release factor N(5)-glutamine methyltransferase [Lapidilactobacillus luobeiensis]